MQNHCDFEIPLSDNPDKVHTASDSVRPIHRLDCEHLAHVVYGIRDNKICFCKPHTEPVQMKKRRKKLYGKNETVQF